ncbi:MAG: hypothetical protein ACRD2X_08600, partial [Vicinamibacteraceae bacterium]
AVRRSRRPDLTEDAPLFSVRAGRRLNRHTIDQVFRQLVPRLHLAIAADASMPRVHDLRHNSGTRIIPSTDTLTEEFPGDRAIAAFSLAA